MLPLLKQFSVINLTSTKTTVQSGHSTWDKFGASPNDLPFSSTDLHSVTKQNGKAKQNTKLLKSQNKVVCVVKNQKIYRSLFTPVQASMAPMGQECEEHRKYLLEQRWIKKIYSKQVRQLSNERPSEIIRKTKPKA